MSNHRHLRVLVIGSGQQSSAVARALISAGHDVVVSTRQPEAPRARALADRGCSVVRGDHDDRRQLVATMIDSDAVFAVGSSREAGTQAEVARGRNLVDAARDAMVSHFVYSSSAGADQSTQVELFDAKLTVERYLRARDVPFTILAPVFFMENLVSHWMLPGLRMARVMLPLPSRRRLQLVSVRDVGSFVALILRRREHFLGKRVEIAGDECTGQQIATVLGRAAGRPIEYTHLPRAAFSAADPKRGRMFSWLDDVGHAVDIAELRAEYPRIEWHSLERWADRRSWAMLRPAGERTAASTV